MLQKKCFIPNGFIIKKQSFYNIFYLNLIIFAYAFNYKMKRYYYITVLAVCAIALLQTVYVKSLYNRYRNENITSINKDMRISIDKEGYFRPSSRLPNKKPKKRQQKIRIKTLKDFSPEEQDSLKRTLPNPSEYLNVDSARAKGIAETSGELVLQMLQDEKMKEGLFLDIKVVDSIFATLRKDNVPRMILLYDSNKDVIQSVGTLRDADVSYASDLIPIGTKGLQYWQYKVSISFWTFAKEQVWPLFLSFILMVFVVGCVTYHLTVIRRKDKLLQKRESTINGTIHDLKTPLNSVVATLGWLKSDETDVAKRKAVEISQTEVKHLVCNIESLLVTVRKDRKQLVLKKENIDIAYIAEVVKSNMDALYRTKPHSIAIENRLPEGVTLFADGMYIENVIRNLVENALKYSDNGVKVVVTLSATEDMLQVAVRDNGWGIAPKYQKKLFHQFYQVPREADKICKGYGIGLAQSKYIIDEHKGKIGVRSAEGEGSVFTFAIPLCDFKEGRYG